MNRYTGPPSSVPSDRFYDVELAEIKPFGDSMKLHAQSIGDGRNLVHAVLLSIAHDKHDEALSKLQAQQGQVPSYWTEYSSEKTVGQTLTEAQVIAGFIHQDHKRVVVFGRSPAADIAYREATAKVGADNVKRVYETPVDRQQQRIARQFGADIILGVRKLDLAERLGGRLAATRSDANANKTGGVLADVRGTPAVDPTGTVADEGEQAREAIGAGAARALVKSY